MKNFKRILTKALGVLLIACVSVSLLVACPDDEPETTYNITLGEYDTTRGFVELSPYKTAYKAGEEITVSIIPRGEFDFRRISLDSNNVSKDVVKGTGEYTYKFNVTRSRTVNVLFRATDKFVVDFEYYDIKGSAQVVSGKEEFDTGEEVTISATPKAGYYLKYLYVDGVDVTADVVNGTYTFTITGDTKVKPVFDAYLTTEARATVDDVDAQIDREGYVLMDFWAPWCGPCVNILAPVLKNDILPLANELNVKILKVEISDINRNPYPENEIFIKYLNMVQNGKLEHLGSDNLGGIPFVVLFKDGKPISSYVGASSNAQIYINWIKSFN